MDSTNLPLGKLEPLASALLTVLLALFNSRIPCNQPCMFQSRSQISIVFQKGARDPVPNGARLTGWSSASHVDYEVEFIDGFGQLKRLTNDHPQRFVWKIAIEWLSIYLDITGSGP
jgi:hypothetical protein